MTFLITLVVIPESIRAKNFPMLANCDFVIKKLRLPR